MTGTLHHRADDATRQTFGAPDARVTADLYATAGPPQAAGAAPEWVIGALVSGRPG